MVQIISDLNNLLRNSELQAANQQFLSHVNVNAYLPADRPSLCVIQGECAVIVASEGLVVGSQDATTCLIALVACTSSRLIWAAHLDDLQLGAADLQRLASALAQMQQPELYLAGGYSEPAGRGPRCAQSFLQLLCMLDARVRVQMCCVGAANTAADGSPACCQLALDTQTWTPQPWLFRDRGPEVPRRFVAQHCRCDSSCSLRPIWDQQLQQIVLPPFETTISAWQAMRYQRLLCMPDDKLLEYMSTSPEHEPAWFVQDMRNMMEWLLAAQEPDSPERQAASSTHKYRWNGSCWQLVCAGDPAVVVEAAAELTGRVGGPSGTSSALGN